MGNVMGEDGLLEKALRELTAAWADAGEGWHDQARDGFAATHLQPLESRTRDAIKAMRQLESLLSEAERQCR